MRMTQTSELQAKGFYKACFISSGSLEAVGFHTSGFHLISLKGHQKFGCPYRKLCGCVLYMWVSVCMLKEREES